MKIIMDVFPKTTSWNTNHLVVPTNNHHEKKGSSTTRWFKIFKMILSCHLSSKLRISGFLTPPKERLQKYQEVTLQISCNSIVFLPSCWFVLGNPQGFSRSVSDLFVFVFALTKKTILMCRTRRIFPTKLQQKTLFVPWHDTADWLIVLKFETISTQSQPS